MSDVNRLKLIFFDLDDTLYEYHGEQVRDVEKAVLSSIVPLVPSLDIWEEYEFIKQKEDKDYINNRIQMKEFYNIACRFSRLLKSLNINDQYLSKKMTKMYWEKTEEIVRAFPDVEPVLRELKKKYKLGILTNGLTTQQRRRVSVIGLEGYFDYFFTSELASADKPSKDYFNFVLNEIKYRSYECALVGDDVVKDIKGANNAGMVTIWYNYKGLQQEMYSSYVINKFKELLQIL